MLIDKRYVCVILYNNLKILSVFRTSYMRLCGSFPSTPHSFDPAESGKGGYLFELYDPKFQFSIINRMDSALDHGL